MYAWATSWRRTGSRTPPTSRQSAATSPNDVPPPAPIAIRSAASVVRATFQPSPSAPTRFAAGTRTSVRNTSLK